MERSWLNIGKEEYSIVASEIVSILNSERISILCLKGDLGAGKTTFSKSLFAVLDVVDEVIDEKAKVNFKFLHFLLLMSTII